MTDSALNQFVARGTSTARAAFTPSPPLSSSGYFWYETDTGNTYAWTGSAWAQVNTSAGSTVNGTFVPAITFGGGSTGITYANQKGVYTKVDKLVFVSVHIQLTNKGSSTGNAVITGLPYSAKSTANYYQVAPAISSPTSAVSWVGYIGIAAGVANDQVGIYTQAVAAVTNATFTNTTQLIATFSYMTD